jgi:uncharacterized protein with ATP-grasp and redox domains
MSIRHTGMLPQPLPAPFGCWEVGSFQQHTLLVRLPEIAQRVLVENELSPDSLSRIQDLIADMPDGRMRNLEEDEAPDAALWQAYMKELIGKSWRELTFLQAEKIFYRRIIEAVGYYRAGETFSKDPYAAQKQLGLHTSGEAVSRLARRLDFWRANPGTQTFGEAVESMLWGNRADLSLWPAGESSTAAPEELHQAEEFLLVNDLESIADGLQSLRGGRVDILVDNAGYELICDLALADVLFGTGLVSAVQLHVKAHPTFVSDAIAADVWQTMRFLANGKDGATQIFGKRLLEAVEIGRLKIRADFFWNAPLPFWDMPDFLAAELRSSEWVICKGDANYRRLTGDVHWQPDIPFQTVTSYFPTRLAALRVSKSDVIIGLAPGQSQRLDRIDASWRTNGRWGMVQALITPPA